MVVVIFGMVMVGFNDIVDIFLFILENLFRFLNEENFFVWFFDEMFLRIVLYVSKFVFDGVVIIFDNEGKIGWIVLGDKCLFVLLLCDE